MYSPSVDVTVVLDWKKNKFKKLSKHVAVWITQTEYCDVHCYGIDRAFVGYNKK
jgi:hypothetical protein